MKNETKRKQRTPEELIAEQEAKLQRLRLRQAKAQAAENPEVAKLIEEKAEAAKRIREAKKILGNGPQSAEARIAKHERWIEKINAEVDEAKTTLNFAEADLDNIDQAIEDAVSEIVKEASA